jgi:purine-binding chemotaxis protein CheW
MLLSIDFAKLIEGQFASVGVAKGGESRVVDIGVSAATGDASIGTGQDIGSSAADELRLVSFSVANQEYALNIAEVQEIVQLPASVSALPNVGGHVLGVISLRERLLPLVSLRTLFGLSRLDYNEQQRIVVTALPGGLRVGLVTDSVKEVLSVSREQADPMPGMLTAGDQLQEFSSICRLDGGKRLVSILATDKLLRLPAIEQALDAARGMGGTQGNDQKDTMDNEYAAAGDPSDDHADLATDEDMQVVIFRLGAEEFGVPIMSVQEIVRVPETLTRVPRTPAFVEGVINLRGTVLPVIDQRSRLGLLPIERSERQRIMVYLLSGKRTGFIVDSVAEVLRIPHANIVPAPAMSSEQSLLISRVAKVDGDKRMVLLIDPAHLLQDREVLAIGKLAQSSTTVDGPVALPLAA